MTPTAPTWLTDDADKRFTGALEFEAAALRAEAVELFHRLAHRIPVGDRHAADLLAAYAVAAVRLKRVERSRVGNPFYLADDCATAHAAHAAAQMRDLAALLGWLPG